MNFLTGTQLYKKRYKLIQDQKKCLNFLIRNPKFLSNSGFFLIISYNIHKKNRIFM